MQPQLLSWKESLKKLNEDLMKFEKWLFLTTSGVLFSEKPAELVMFREKRFGIKLDVQLERARYLGMLWGLGFFEVYRDNRGVRAIIYNHSRVNGALKKIKNMPFFIKVGYGENLTAEQFFGKLRAKWEQSGRIPHEIAVVLGYPIKDIVGYLKMTSIEYRGTCGWKMYGNLEQSMRIKRKYDRAKEIALKFLQES
ncbi:MAG TPA: hypothetical protein DEA47_05580 [Peptococcaceae bacterium]|nr:MAG: hypothetical protein XD50_0747 [Clostridia bacterium 41_269]HBT20812.1 hypothetical protein [Peptococcaceae bacterium]